MSTGTQIDPGLLPNNAQQSDSGAPTGSDAHRPDSSAGNGARTYLTDEEILGIAVEPHRDSLGPDSGQASSKNLLQKDDGVQTDGDAQSAIVNSSARAMPAWMRSLTGDPKHGAEVQQLWQEHQAFRASFSSPDEARAIKELFPGGAQEARTLKQSAQAVDQLDAAIYSGDPRAQSEVVAEMARANPAAFRQLFAEAAKVLGTMGQGNTAVGVRSNASVQPQSQAAPGQVAAQAPPQTSPQTRQFDSTAYAAFERSTNDIVARGVRDDIVDALTRVLPEGVAEGAARRIGDDIFNEIHRTLAADQTLSQQVGEVLRGWRFGTAEQQRIASMLTGRAKQLVPGVARRVIGEWTSSVLGTARTKAARQAAAAARVDIGAPGGSRDSMPLRAMSSRDIDYARMSDNDILGI